MKPPRRTLTTFAVGFLLLDAVLLVYAGAALGRPGLLGLGTACLGLAVVVVVAWRRYRRALADIERARREMKAEVEAIRDLLHTHHLDN